MGHESKCKHVHGHNYVAFITASAPELDDLGRVIDFGVLKERIGGWIDEHWDHGFIYNYGDPVAFEIRDLIVADDGTTQKAYGLNGNPTAENMAAELLKVANELLSGTVVKVTKVELWETENCYAAVWV